MHFLHAPGWWLAWWHDIDTAAQHDLKDASQNQALLQQCWSSADPGTPAEVVEWVAKLRAYDIMRTWQLQVLRAHPALLVRFMYYHRPDVGTLTRAWQESSVAQQLWCKHCEVQCQLNPSYSFRYLNAMLR